MDIESPHPARRSSTRRSTNGCWTCRLRRKKCDEKQPVCDTCAALLITCHNGQDKPDWMDGGPRQEEMAEQIKREVKEKAHIRLRGWEREIPPPGNQVRVDGHGNGIESLSGPSGAVRVPHRGPDCTLLSEEARANIAFGRSDTVLLMFYLENVLPCLFPFYNPSALDGGKSWILEMMISSPLFDRRPCLRVCISSLLRGGQ